MYEVKRERFEAIVSGAIDDLPPEFRERIANLDIAVEDWAGPNDYTRTKTAPGHVMLGVYRGIPLTRRGRVYNMALPDRIVVFQQPIQRLASDETDLEQRIEHVVQHEIAHYFGISDDRLKEIDAY